MCFSPAPARPTTSVDKMIGATSILISRINILATGCSFTACAGHR